MHSSAAQEEKRGEREASVAAAASAMDAQPAEHGSEEITECPRPCPGLLLPGILLPHQLMTLCARWSSVGIKKSCLPAVELPWLMLVRHQRSHDEEGDLDEFEGHYRCTFFTPSDGRVQRLSVPELHRRLWRGSSYGWLITVLENSAGNDGEVSLFNPLTRDEIALPPQRRCPLPIVLDRADLDRFRAIRSKPCFLKKAILSCDPDDEGCKVVAITSFHNLCFCNVGDERWSVFDDLYEVYEDIVFFKGQLYAVNAAGRLSTFDMQSSPPSWRTLDSPCFLFDDIMPGEICSKCLVGAGEQLLLVLRLLRKDGRFSETVGFEVFRWEEDSPAWKKVKDLGGRMLFLGMNCSEAFPADMFPNKSGFKGDCIYYTGDGGVGRCMDLRAPCVSHDLGVYSMEDGVIEAFFSPAGEDEEELVYPPIWVSANPWPVSLQQRTSDL